MITKLILTHLAFWIFCIPIYSQIKLSHGDSLKTEISPGDSHLYELKLKEGQYVEAIFLQQGVDIGVRLLDANKDSLGFVDSPNGKDGPERYEFVAESSENYFFLVKPLSIEDDNTIDPADSAMQTYLAENKGNYNVHITILTARAYQKKLSEKAAKLDRVAKWFNQEAQPFDHVAANNGFEDLQFLKTHPQECESGRPGRSNSWNKRVFSNEASNAGIFGDGNGV